MLLAEKVIYILTSKLNLLLMFDQKKTSFYLLGLSSMLIQSAVFLFLKSASVITPMTILAQISQKMKPIEFPLAQVSQQGAVQGSHLHVQSMQPYQHLYHE